MNLNEAYSVLGLSQGTSPEDAKKKYRDLTKKFHPDVNKEPGAEDKFKKINEAYECVKSGRGSDPMPQQHANNWGGFANFINIQDLFNNGRQQQNNVRQEQNIELKTNVSFKESVLGCKREFSYKRKIKCESCNGLGMSIIHNGCAQCNGTGTVTIRHGNMITNSTCNKCMGKRQKENCNKCNVKGFVEADTNISVNIPAGIENEQTLRLQNMGNFSGVVNNFMGMGDLYTHTNIFINVVNLNGLSIVGQDVVSNIDISLLEALQGTSKTVHTVDGDKTININSQIKNKDEIDLPNLGVNRVGKHRIIINIKYPKNVNALVEYLKSEDLIQENT